MYRSSLAIAAALLACVGPCAAAQSPAPATSGNPKAIKHVLGLSNKLRARGTTNSHVSAAACNRRAVGVNSSQGTLGPNGASTSQTLINVPVGGESVAAATRQQQISEACAHQRH